MKSISPTQKLVFVQSNETLHFSNDRLYTGPVPGSGAGHEERERANKRESARERERASERASESESESERERERERISNCRFVVEAIKQGLQNGWITWLRWLSTTRRCRSESYDANTQAKKANSQKH